jgi:hypothetical protein
MYIIEKFEVFTALTIKSAVFWEIKPQFVRHRTHITFPLQSPASYCYVRYEVLTGVTEECRLLGYKNPVRTSQEIHYVSSTQSSYLMLCKI